MNPYVYDWDDVQQRPVRKNRLKRPAGCWLRPGIRRHRARQHQLTISFDNMMTGSSYAPYINSIIKQFRKLNINLEINTTDYNRFQDKINTGNFQFFNWGWNADYPDPENFFFLLFYNARQGHGVENATGYVSAKFDELFRRMETMDNTLSALRSSLRFTAVIAARRAAAFRLFPMAYSLYHESPECEAEPDGPQ